MKFLVLLLLVVAQCAKAYNPLVVDIISSENFSQRYQAFLQGRSVHDVTDFRPTTQGSHIEIIEMVLLQQALFLGGETREVVFNPKPSVNILEFTDMVAGESLMLARTVWHEDVINYRGSVYVSDPVVKFGEYEAGIYVAKRNQALHQTTQDGLEQLTLVANPRWRVDWRALTNSNMNLVSFIGPWESMLNMVETDIVDGMLVNFSVSDSLQLVFEGRDYVPIKGVKMVLPDSRHFIVSKRHPEGAQIFAALNRGLKELRRRGTIRKALTESGFINRKVQDWAVINRAMLPQESRP
ncbi:hypothetical protein [Pseudoalteromonas rubra]|uniref:Solute-binding protein family 3/N-terminal domain-containing protein n=1 Tax=Pseudoalteromonas rubra TaxID=43658 RepID=A0A0U2X9Y9_9GAMM|nr:hypothetical protein [Pseudoalteromonas rubra]ALU44660.1 hypothetical protein AT705_17955 [Pseudoalteromonas rubra]